MQKWEYARVHLQPAFVKTIEICEAGEVQKTKNLNIDEILKDLGERGWELVADGPESAYGHTMIFKRPKM